MTTIDQLDISVYNRYALFTQAIEQTKTQFRLDEASSIPPQTQVTITTATLSELDLLLGVVPTLAPWAYFFAPKPFKRRRRYPFSFAKIAPSLGSIQEGEEDYQTLLAVRCSTPEEEEEKAALLGCFKQISKLNNWLGFIVGRLGQFLQG